MSSWCLIVPPNVIHLTKCALGLDSVLTEPQRLQCLWRGEERSRWQQNNTISTGMGGHMTVWCSLMQHRTESSPGSYYKLYESPTWTACRSRMHRSLTSSKGHRLESMRRWARVSFSSLFGGFPEARGDRAGDGMGLMASTFFMTNWRMFSMASVLEMASRLPSPSHLPKDSWSCTSIFWCRTNVCAVLQQATQQVTHETVYVYITASK